MGGKLAERRAVWKSPSFVTRGRRFVSRGLLRGRRDDYTPAGVAFGR